MRTRALRTDLGHFRWAEAARKGELDLVGHFLVAKHQDGMLLEGRAHHRIYGVVRGDIGEPHPAQFGGESRTQWDDLHRQVLPVIIACNFRAEPPGRQRQGRTGRPYRPSAALYRSREDRHRPSLIPFRWRRRPPAVATIAGARPSFWPAPDLAVDGAFVAAGVCADSDIAPRLRPVAHLGVVSLPMRQKGAKIFRRPNPPEGRSLHCD